jgi:PAS domain S-box-containing protein
MESPNNRLATVEVFFDTFRQIACVTAYTGQFLAANAAFSAALGWTEQELREMAYYELVATSERQSMIKLGALIVRHAGSEPRLYRRAFRHKDGSYRLIEWSAWADATANLVCATGRLIGMAEPRSRSALVPSGR